MIAALSPRHAEARPAPAGEPAPAVVCLHASASSARQWRPLVEMGGQGWSWHLPGLFQHGGLPGWPEAMPARLHVEARSVLAQLDLPEDRGFHLVGHSYGAAVALQIALMHPQRVRSLVLYEPAAFGLLAGAAPMRARSEIQAVAAQVGAALAEGDDLLAARGFCAYWHGRDIWPGLDPAQQVRLAELMPAVQQQFRALFAAAWSPILLGRLRMPVTLLYGSRTRSSARAVTDVLASCLRAVQVRRLEGAGHMTPVTEPARVAALVLQALVPARPALLPARTST